MFHPGCLMPAINSDRSKSLINLDLKPENRGVPSSNHEEIWLFVPENVIFATQSMAIQKVGT